MTPEQAQEKARLIIAKYILWDLPKPLEWDIKMALLSVAQEREEERGIRRHGVLAPQCDCGRQMVWLSDSHAACAQCCVQRSESAESKLQEREQEIERLTRERDEKQRLNEYFRDSVGECHVMISRNTAEYQIRSNWEPADLPPRLQKVIQRAQALEASVKELEVERDQRIQNHQYEIAELGAIRSGLESSVKALKEALDPLEIPLLVKQATDGIGPMTIKLSSDTVRKLCAALAQAEEGE